MSDFYPSGTPARSIIGQAIQAGDKPRRLVDAWLQSVAKNTELAYRTDYNALARWLGCDYTALPARVSVWSTAELMQTVFEWAGDMKTSSSPATVNRRIASLRAMRNIMATAGYCDQCPKLPHYAVRNTKRSMATPDYVATLLDAIKGDSLRDWRDRTLIHCMWGLGVRGSTIRQLRVTHVDLARREINNVETKNGYQDYTLTDTLANVFEEYFQRRAKWLTGYVFTAINHVDEPMHADRPLAHNSLVDILKRRCEAANVPYVSPHAYRRGGITAILDATGDLAAAQQYAGHKSITATLAYDQQRHVRARVARRAVEVALIGANKGATS